MATKDVPPAPDDGAGRSTIGTVLVVDDEPMVCMLVAAALGDAGYTVLEAGDGHAGLRILQSPAQIDLLISDVGLPGGMNGRQLAAAARDLRPDLKVLFITGYTAEAAMNQGVLEDGTAVLVKPFAMNELAAAVAQMMRR